MPAKEREVTIFIDGEAMYQHQRRVRERFDYEKLCREIDEELNAKVVGVRYYALETPNMHPAVATLWGALEEQGAKVVRIRPFFRRHDCVRCGCSNETSFNVVPRELSNDVLRGVVEKRVQITVIVSGRSEFVQAIRLLNKTGHETHIAFWRSSRLNAGLHKVLPDHFINLDNLDVFQDGHRSERRW